MAKAQGGTGYHIGLVSEAMTEDQKRGLQIGEAFDVVKFEPRGGRPTDYREDMPDKVFELLTDRSGAVWTRKAIAAYFDIDESTLYDWIKRHPRFAKAFARGLALQEAFFASRLADGMRFGNSLIFALKNLHKWTDRHEETLKVDIRDALKKAATSAKRVQWDKTKPPVIEATIVEPPALTPPVDTPAAPTAPITENIPKT